MVSILPDQRATVLYDLSGYCRRDRPTLTTPSTTRTNCCRCSDALVNVIFCIKGSDQRYLAVNTAFVQRTGRTSKRDVIGKRATELFPRELAESYEAQGRHVVRYWSGPA